LNWTVVVIGVSDGFLQKGNSTAELRYEDEFICNRIIGYNVNVTLGRDLDQNLHESFENVLYQYNIVNSYYYKLFCASITFWMKYNFHMISWYI